jgi:hypothetical protein
MSGRDVRNPAETLPDASPITMSLKSTALRSRSSLANSVLSAPSTKALMSSAAAIMSSR